MATDKLFSFSEPPKPRPKTADFGLFSKLCFSGIWKGEKYKPYILKYKALILKQVPCIFCYKAYVFLRVKNRAVLLACDALKIAFVCDVIPLLVSGIRIGFLLV